MARRPRPQDGEAWVPRATWAGPWFWPHEDRGVPPLPVGARGGMLPGPGSPASRPRPGKRTRPAGIIGQRPRVRGRTPGLPPAGRPPARWRCGCRARTARRARRRGGCESTTTGDRSSSAASVATGRGRRRSARRPRRAGCPLTPRLRRQHATGNGSGQPVRLPPAGDRGVPSVRVSRAAAGRRSCAWPSRGSAGSRGSGHPSRAPSRPSSG